MAEPRTAPAVLGAPTWAATAVIVGLAPLVRVVAEHQGFGLRAAGTALAVAATTTGLVAVRRRGGGLLALAGVAGGGAVLAAVAGGRIVGVWFAVGAALAAWLVLDEPAVLLGRQADRRVLPVVLVLEVAAAVVARDPFALTDALAVAVLAGLVAVLAAWWPWPLDRVEALVGAARARREAQAPGAVRRALATAVRAVRRVVRPVLVVVVGVPLWLLTALVPWLADRLVGFDGLRQRGGSGWLARDGRPEAPARAWSPDTRLVGASWGQRMHARLPSVVIVLAVVALLVVPGLVDDGPPPHRNAALDRMRAEPRHDQVLAETRQVLEHYNYSQFAGPELSDASGRYVNVEHRRRRTWRTRPGSCDGPARRVWVFGGSTVFGVEQTDDGTLPSALARHAARQGVRLDVENFGVPGDVVWQQARRLERALLEHPKPDLVVFWDGYNDYAVVRTMDYSDRGGAGDLVALSDPLQIAEMDHVVAGIGNWFLSRRPDQHPTLTREQAVVQGARQFAAGDRDARILARSAGVPFLHVLQPSLESRDRPVAGEDPVSPEDRRDLLAFAARAPRSVADLTGALDDLRAPVYLDHVHTIEQANDHLAAKLYDELVHRHLLPATGGTPCPS